MKGQNINDLTAELIVHAENNLNRELSPLEKIACVSAAFNIKEANYEYGKHELSEELIDKAAEWGNKIFGELSKVAKEEEKKDSKMDNILLAGGGAAAGLLLGMRNRRILDKLKNKEILENTSHLRELGNLAGKKYKEYSDIKDKNFEKLFEGIEDPKHRAQVKQITKDIDKVLYETSKKTPNIPTEKYKVNKEFTRKLDDAYSTGQIPKEVHQYLKRSIDKKFPAEIYVENSPVRNSIPFLGATPNSINTQKEQLPNLKLPELKREVVHKDKTKQNLELPKLN